jgi:hypothetical protein
MASNSQTCSGLPAHAGGSTTTDNLHELHGDADSSDDEFWYYEYEMVDEKKDEEDQRQLQDAIANRLPPKSPTYLSGSSSNSTSPIVQGVAHEEEAVVEEELVQEEDVVVEEDSSVVPPPCPSAGTTNPAAPTIAPSPSRKPFGVSVRKSLNVSQPPPPPPEAAPPINLTPSKQRAKAASSAGLSELSKQLRILQAKNESQAVDINRLERQLRILADLQGISVSDLRKALEDACASEAFGELQNRVAKLKFELEAATLAKQAELRKDTTAPHIANLELRVGELEEVEEKQRAEIHHLYEQLRHERAKSTRLESENEQMKLELQEAMKRLQQEQARAARLEATMQEQMRKFQLEQAQRMQAQALQARQAAEVAAAANNRKSRNAADTSSSSTTASTVPANGAATTAAAAISDEIAAEYERMVQLMKQKDEELRIARARLHAQEIEWVQKMRDAEGKARQAQMDIKVEHDKLALTVKELEDADGQSGLRLAQYKARFAVQDERIEDMEQQLDSLYTAFTLLKEEFDSENLRHAAMLNNLNDADAEVARQANKMEKQKSQHGGFNGTTSLPSAPGRASSDASIQSVPRVISTPSWIATPTTTRVTPDTPSTASIRYDTMNQSSASRRGFETPLSAYASAEAYEPTPQRTPSTWQLLFPQEHDTSSRSIQSVQPRIGDRLMSGPLIVESKSMLRKWKTKHSKIYLRGDHHQWEIGDKRSFPLLFGISKVEFHPNYPLSFVVHVNPYDTMAPVIRAATSNERDYHRWMAALTKATSGGEYEGGPATPEIAHPATPPTRRSTMERTSPSQMRGLSSRSAFARSSSDSARSVRSSGPSVEDQEASDLRRILELSKHEV